MATSRPRFLVLGIFILSWGLAFFANGAQSDKPPFYKISYQGKTAYLLGSIHVGKADFYPLAPQIASAFERAGALAIEADVENADIIGLIRQYGTRAVPQGATIQARMQAYCALQAPLCTALQGYSPWMQAMQLSVMRFEGLGYQAQWGVDQVLVADNGERPLFELESAEFQFQLLASFEPETQWQMVIEAIDAPDEEMLQLISRWRSGDEAGLDALMQGQMHQEGDDELIDKMLWQRNTQMSQKIAQLLQRSDTLEPLFVVVGAGHVVGDKSIPVKMQQMFDAEIQNCWLRQCD